MDFGDENEHAVGKGPFYGGAAFIFVVVALFASVGLKENGTLHHWEIATCLLGTGLIVTLLFLPHFLQGIVDQFGDQGTQATTALTNKAILELKELRSELDSIAVKIDKVPTLVDKIVNDSLNAELDPSDSITEKFKLMQQEITAKLDRMEEATLALPLSPETDPQIENLQSKTEEISKRLGEVFSKLESIEKLQNQQPSTPENPTAEPDTPELLPTEKEPVLEEETETEQENIQTSPLEEEEEEDLLDPIVDDPEEGELSSDPTDTEEIPEMSSSNSEEDEVYPTEADPEEEEVDLLTSLQDDAEEKEEVEEAEEPGVAKDTSQLEEKAEMNEPETELDLGLPDPAETLRKVDALLAGENNPEKVSPPVPKVEKVDKNETTTVVANVMIGIGNKPYLRGEGPGLSWDEGVAMNFIEIGKWAWSPPRKNASLTVQLYRNDQDPDQGGKIEVRPGERLEINPDFG